MIRTVPIPLPTIEDSDVEDAQGFPELLAAISRCTRPFNYLALPALSLPCGFGAGGLPVGFQLVARPFEEETLFRVGAAHERATAWTQKAPNL